MLLLSSFIVFAQSQVLPIKLKCEHLENPVGIDSQKPRLSWQLSDLRMGAKQRGYFVYVGADSLEVTKGVGNCWSFGKKDCDKTLIIYDGQSLRPFSKYFWAVQVLDMDGNKSEMSEVASFHTGMMKMKNWQGHWITDTRDVNLRPAPYFRKEFKVDKKIRSALAYIAVGGLYELFINGKRVGNHQLDPAYTRFDRRNLYQAYDLTNFISEENCIGVSLGNGWYNHQSTAVWFFHEAPWRARPRFCFDLKIFYEDGTTETVSTGTNWKTTLGPVISNSIYTAEHYDASKEIPGWNKAGFDDSEWKNSMATPAPSQNIVSQTLHPIRYTDEVEVADFSKINNQKYIYKLEKNIAGISKITLRGNSGTVVRLTHSEMIDENGEIDQSNIVRHYRPTDDSDPFQTDIFILSGRGDETFYPRFNYKGFQYVEVTSSEPIDLNEKSLIGLEMHSDVPVVGSISSSNETLNKIWEAANSSYLANLFGYPTDCPQREKNGWTGDAHLASEMGLYNFDGITIYEKWIADHMDEQQPNGVLPAIIPTSGWGYQWANGPDWTSTIAIIPWNIYLFYGDSKLLEETYGNIKRYVDYISGISEGNLTDWGLGDWCPYKAKSSKKFTSSIYYYIDASILANAAKLFGKTNDFEKYSRLALDIKEALNAEFFDQKRGIYCSGTQTELSAALHWGIVPVSYKQKVADKLAQKVIEDNSHVDVGILGSKTLLNALSDNGYADLAYKVASQETFPSWGWWIKNGSTTFIENWKMGKETNDNSQNHIMFGEISAWYFKALGGIKLDPVNPGFKHFFLEPHFVEGLDQFDAKFNSVYGEVVSSWERKKGKVEYHVIVPANSSATLVLSGEKIRCEPKIEVDRFGEKHKVVLLAGTYKFVVDL